MLIYKIFRPEEWAALQSTGHTLGAPIDLTDGYIHFSSASQVIETAAKHFAGAGDLKLAAVESDGLDGLRWEPSRGGQDFPHLYRALHLSEVLWCVDLPETPAGHVFPELA